MRESLRRLASDERMGSPRWRAVGHRRVTVDLLDGGVLHVEVERKAKGGDLLDKVCDELGVIEKDFFGLLHAVKGDPRVWVDLNRRLSKTFKNEPWEVQFAVKFYPAEPSELTDDYTRDQLLFAVRRDIMEGRLSCSFITHALLGSYVLQAALGDAESTVDAATILQHHAASAARLDGELEDKINELYALHRGQSPAEAVLNYLENAKKLPQYGCELHCARDSHTDLVLAVCANGVAIYRDGALMNRFPWAKLSKISYNKKVFTLKLRPSEFEEYETSLQFHVATARACKRLWRCAVEHHIFFRRAEPVVVEKIRNFPRFGSRRLSCRRTLRQLRAEPIASYRQTELTA